MKVAVYSHSIPPAVDGVSRRFTSLIYELHSAGHEVLVFTLEDAPTMEKSLFPLATAPVLRYVTLQSTFHKLYPSKRVAAPTLVNQFRIMQAMAYERPEVVHVTVDAIALMFGLSGKLLNIPVVGSIHTDVQTALACVGAPSIALFGANFKEQMEARLLDGCATTSPSFREKLNGQGIHCDYIIRTAVAVDKFQPEAKSASVRERLTFGHPEGLLAVYVGRLAPEKGLDTLIAMCQQVDNVYLALIGDGPLGQQLGMLHGAGARIYCRPGFLPHAELPAIYASADVHVTCSLFETLGNTVLEAHGCGTPVVVPRTQGFIDTVSHRVDGFLYNPSLPVEGAGVLTRLRDDRSLCQSLGANGRQKVLQQSPALVARDAVEWYKRRAQELNIEANAVYLLKTLQLFGMVLILICSWRLYNLPGDIILWAGSLGAHLRQVRNMIGNFSFINRFSQMYNTITHMPVAVPKNYSAQSK